MSVLAVLEGAGLTVRLSQAYVDPQLLVSPRGAVTPALRAIILSHREELVDELYGREMDVIWPPVDQESLDKLSSRWAPLDAKDRAIDAGMFGASAHSEENRE